MNVSHPVGKPGDIFCAGARRLAIRASNNLDDWYVGYSPRNDNEYDEGTWSEWVDLARLILKLEDERIRSDLKK